MSANDASFIALMGQVQREIGSGAEDSMMVRHEQMFINALMARNRERLRQRWLVVSTALAVLTVITVFLALLCQSPTQLNYRTTNVQMSSTSADWLLAPSDGEGLIRFEQGSQFRLSSRSSVQMMSHSSDLVQLALISGKMHARVIGNGKTQWKINAGPFVLSVSGTAFSVIWKADRSIIAVEVEKGPVLVQGALLSEHGIELQGGNAVWVDAQNGTVKMSPKILSLDAVHHASIQLEPIDVYQVDVFNSRLRMSDKRDTVVDAPVLLNSEANNDRLVIRRTPDGDAVGAMSPIPEWLLAYRRENYSEALLRARATGVDEIMEESSADQLWCLAETARQLGEAQLQQQVLERIRQRFPESDKSKVAAYMLGHILLAHPHEKGLAARWFKMYLQEASRGKMRQEAYRSLMTAYWESGQMVRARDTAEQYLDEYPNGLYAFRALELTGLFDN
ncbi:MAG: FecR domain-containing protein [Deltaproteobacteria bacterium]|nr:FecR domain-containing protein [Deltaproteobacteria bacterium]